MDHHIVAGHIQSLANAFMYDRHKRPLLFDGKTRDWYQRTAPPVGMLFGWRVSITDYKVSHKTAFRERLFLLSERYHCFIGTPAREPQNYSIPAMCSTFDWHHASSHDSSWHDSLRNEIFKCMMDAHKEVYGNAGPVPAHSDFFQQFGVRIFDPFVFVNINMVNDDERNEQEHHSEYWKKLVSVEEVPYSINLKLPEVV